MVPRSEQIRLAITVFDELERLWNTALDLLDVGLAVDQICLIAMENTATALRRSSPAIDDPADRQRLSPLLEHMEPWTVTANGARVVGTGGRLLGSLKSQQPMSQGNEVLALVIGGQKVDLGTIIGQGAVALLVQSADPSQQSRVTRTLLSHSTHWVTTHEFAAPSEDEGG